MAAKYSTADYGFQFVTVTVGVLVALLIDGLVDWNHNRELVRDAHAAIRREVADNLKEMEGLPNSVATANAQVDNALKFVDDTLSKGTTDVHSLQLEFNLATLNQSSWQSADRTGALAHMTYEQVKDYSELYGLQDLFMGQQRKAIDLVSNAITIVAGGDPNKAPKEDLVQFRQQLLALRSNIFVTEQLGVQLTEAYRKFLQSNRP
jgi:hypothetical protein